MMLGLNLASSNFEESSAKKMKNLGKFFEKMLSNQSKSSRGVETSALGLGDSFLNSSNTHRRKLSHFDGTKKHG
jgi:hypothetical protein